MLDFCKERIICWVHYTHKSMFCKMLKPDFTGHLQGFSMGQNWERAFILQVQIKLSLSQSQMVQ